MDTRNSARRLRMLAACATLAGAALVFAAAPAVFAADYIVSGGGGGGSLSADGTASAGGQSGAEKAATVANGGTTVNYTGSGEGGAGSTSSGDRGGGGGGGFAGVAGDFTGTNDGTAGGSGSGGIGGAFTDELTGDYTSTTGSSTTTASGAAGGGVAGGSSGVVINNSLASGDTLLVSGGSGGDARSGTTSTAGRGGDIGNVSARLIVNLQNTSGGDIVIASGDGGASSAASSGFAGNGGRGGHTYLDFVSGSGAGNPFNLGDILIQSGKAGTKIGSGTSFDMTSGGNIVYSFNNNVVATSVNATSYSGGIIGYIDGSLTGLTTTFTMKSADTSANNNESTGDHTLGTDGNLTAVSTSKDADIGSGNAHTAYRDTGDIVLQIGNGGLNADNADGAADGIKITTGTAGYSGAARDSAESGSVTVTIADGGMTAGAGNITIGTGLANGDSAASGDISITVGGGGVMAEDGGIIISTGTVDDEAYSGAVTLDITGSVVAKTGGLSLTTGNVLTNFSGGETGSISFTVSDNVIVGGDMTLKTGSSTGDDSGVVNANIAGTVVSAGKLSVASGATTSLSNDDADTGLATLYVGGDVITANGYEVLVGGNGGADDAEGELGGAAASIAGDLVILGAGVSNDITFQAGNAGAGWGSGGGSNFNIDRAWDDVAGDYFTENNIDGDVGALHSDLSITGGNTSEDWSGGHADITVGGEGMTKAQWTAYMASVAGQIDILESSGVDIASTGAWAGGDLKPVTFVNGEEVEDTASRFAVVVNSITLTGGAVHADGDDVVGGSATLTLTNDTQSVGAGIYSAGDISILTGEDNSSFTDVAAGKAGIIFEGAATDGTLLGNNVYLGGNMTLHADYRSTASLENAGAVVFLGDTFDGNVALTLTADAANAGVTYDAQVTDFSNLRDAGQTATITVDGVNNVGNITLGDVRYGLNTVFDVDTAATLTQILNGAQVFTAAGSVIDLGGFDFEPQDGIDFVFDIGADASFDPADPENVMVTYENGDIDFGNNTDNAVTLNLADGNGDLANAGLIGDGNWMDTLVLIKNDSGNEINGHIKDGDHNQIIQTNDYDIIAAIYKGGVNGSEILVNRIDARYLKGQAMAQNRIAATGFMNTTWDSAWSFLDRFASAYDECGGIGTFGSIGYTGTRIGGDTGRYGSDSKVEVDGMNVIAGMHYRTRNAERDGLFTGVFFEGGWGDYDAYDTFDLTGSSGNVVRSHGKGDVNYYGGGVYMRKELPIGLNVMAAARVGQLDTNYGNSAFTGGKFDMDAMYYGASLGLSWDVSRADRHRIEPFAAFHWSRQEGKDRMTPYAGARFDVDDVDSLRLQLGVKYAYTFKCDENGGSLKGFAGAAWEHEFDGEAVGHMWYGSGPGSIRTRNDTLKGSTGVGHVGIRYESGARWYVDAAIHGSVGKRDSWGGNIGAGVSF